MSDPQLPPPGWYADPGGVPDRLRWWDGREWAPQVRDAGRRSPRLPWLIAGGLLALVVIAVVAVPSLVNPSGPATRTGAAQPTRTPTFGGSPGGPVPAPSISADRPTTGPRVGDPVCSSGVPDHRQPRRTPPGRISGGGLQVALPPGWSAQEIPPLPFGNDMAGARPAGGDSAAWVGVGAIRAEIQEFAAPRLATRAIATCLRSLPEFRDLEERDSREAPATVPGSRETAGLLVQLGARGGPVRHSVFVIVSDTGVAESMPFVVAVGPPETGDNAVLGFGSRLTKEG